MTFPHGEETQASNSISFTHTDTDTHTEEDPPTVVWKQQLTTNNIVLPPGNCD